jgi:hypothetical protein
MHEHLKSIPVEHRPKMISLFPAGACYFRTWQTFRWFLVLLWPVASSVASIYVRKHAIGVVILVGLTGVFVAATLFVDLCSGMASSNWGTYFRETEPRRYWSQVAIVAGIYGALSSAGYFV